MENDYLVTVYANDRMGLLLRIVQNIYRKNLNIEKLTFINSAVDGVKCINFVVRTDIGTIKNLTKYLDKQVDVLQSFYVYQNVNILSERHKINSPIF